MGGLGNNLFQYAYLYAQVREGKIPDIYLQDEKYFEKYKHEILTLLRTDIVDCDYVSLHIRRGDYVNNPFYVDLTQTDYYAKAIIKFQEEDPNVKFLVFCADRQGGDDKADMEWCKDYLLKPLGLLEKYFEFHQGKDEIEDFNRMAGCKSHVMANSSFSWWASYVGGGRTIAPSQWFANGTRINYPSNFEVI